MSNDIYGIEEFGRDDRCWRVAWFGATKINPEVPSELVIQVLLSAMPDGATDPFSNISLRSDVTNHAWIGVGQLPYVSIGSVWCNTKPVANGTLHNHVSEFDVDTSSIKFVSIDDLIKKHKVIPMSRYAFYKNYTHAAKTMVAAIQVGDDPWAVLIPVIELVRFYYASSTRLAQALFWGEYAEAINDDKCGPLPNGAYRVHLRKWVPDSDAWTLARLHASKFMQQNVVDMYKGIQLHSTTAGSAIAPPFHALECGFPFAGKTTLRAVTVPLSEPGVGAKRVLVLKLLRCSAPFPFDKLICDRDNKNFQGEESGEAELRPAWKKPINNADPKKGDADNNLHSDGEPSNLGTPLTIDIAENRFADLDGKELIKEPTLVQKYRSEKTIPVEGNRLKGFATGQGIWGKDNRNPAQVHVDVVPPVTSLPVTLNSFLDAIAQIASAKAFVIRYVQMFNVNIFKSETPGTMEFPTWDEAKSKKLKWAEVVLKPKTKRVRKVVVVEFVADNLVCYVLEAERIRKGEKFSVLVVAKADFTAMNNEDLQSILLASAKKGGWPSTGEMVGYRRGTTSHRGKVIAGRSAVDDGLAKRIDAKVRELLGMDIVEVTSSAVDTVGATSVGERQLSEA